MNKEKKIAEAILDAQKMHEESYTRGSGVEGGVYKRGMEECLIVACTCRELSSNLWYLLNLANHNDIQMWAKDILAGNIISDDIEG